MYELEFHKSLDTDEVFEIYNKYEKSVHGKEKNRGDLKGHLCSSPAYDENDENEKYRIERPAPYDDDQVDDGREFKNEGLCPGKGSYHLYHRIDGKLVAVGVLDITENIFNSQYFIYDPEFAFLHLGVVGAIHEIEYMRMRQEKFNQVFNQYALGELVIDCPKVNYKLNYKPGLVVCPRTKQLVKFDDVKQKMKDYAKIPIK